MSIDDWRIEKVHLGTATDAERAAVMGDPDAVAALERLAAEDAAFHARHDADEQLSAIRRKAHLQATRQAVADRRRRLGGLGLGVMVLAGAAALMMARPEVGPVTEGEVVHDGRAKGLAAALVVHRQSGDGEEVLRDGASASAGDVLQLGYRAAGAPHGVVVSIDGRGEVTLHHPASPGGSTALERGGETALPHAYRLDDAPRYERFFLVTDDQPIDVQAVLAAAERLASGPEATRGPLGQDAWHEVSVLLLKGAR
jgi:hypothetical protein